MLFVWCCDTTTLTCSCCVVLVVVLCHHVSNTRGQYHNEGVAGDVYELVGIITAGATPHRAQLVHKAHEPKLFQYRFLNAERAQLRQAHSKGIYIYIQGTI